MLWQMLRELLVCVALPSAVLVSARVVAQQTPPASQQQRTDEQIANDINTKLTASSTLRPLGLSVWVHGGTATLSGTIPNQAARQQAQELVQSVPGVIAVDDKLVVGASPANTQAGQTGPANSPQPPEANPQGTPPPPGPPPPPPTAEELRNSPPPSVDTSPENEAPQESEDQQGPSNLAPLPSNGDQESASQPANQPLVTVPAGTPLYVMMQQTVDSKHTQPGSPFRAIVAQNVMLPNGAVAIPRGAYVEGTVIDARPSGQLKGRPQLALQLFHLNVAEEHYPLATSTWASAGPGKGGQTAGTVVGTTAFGAAVGGIVGGGPTALLGAALGGLGGLGISALSPGAHLLVPAESIITFRLHAPLTVREPTPGEMRALGNNLPPPAYRYRGYGYGYPPPGYPPPPPAPPVPGAPPGGYPY